VIVTVLFQQPFWRIVRGVGQEGRVPHVEGLVLLDGHVDKLEAGLETFASDLQSIISMPPALLREAPSHSMGKAASLVVAFPPLATLMTQVSLFAEKFR